MPRRIQIRNIPDDLHRLLIRRAADLGMSLSGYLLSELKQVAGKPTLPELVERLRLRGPIAVDESPAQVIRKHRGT